MKNKIWTCLVLAALSLFCAANGAEKPEKSPRAHTLNLGYSSVLRSSYYKEWKPVPPLKFSLNYAYDIPMCSRVVNFYAIGEVSYIGAYKKDAYTSELPSGVSRNIVTENLNTVILSAGMGLKFHLVSFLDFAVFYSIGFHYTSCEGEYDGNPTYKALYYSGSGFTGGRFIGKIGKINVFAGYSLVLVGMVAPYDHYVDIGIGYTF